MASAAREAVLWLVDPEHLDLPSGTADAGATIAYWTRPGGRHPARQHSATAIVLPDLVEQQRASMRARYLDLLGDLAQFQVDDRTIEDWLRVRPDLSAWWLGLPLEYSLDEHSSAFTVTRLWALENCARVGGYRVLVNTVSDSHISVVLRTWARAIGLEYREVVRTRALRGPGRGGLLSLLREVKATLGRGILLARQFLPASRLRLRASQPAAPDVVVIDYLAQTEAEAVRRGRYSSGYWGELPSVLDEAGVRSRWFHVFVPGSAGFGARHLALSAVRALRRAGHHHELSFEWASLATWSRAILDYLRLRRRSGRAVGRLERFWDTVDINLWPVLRPAIESSFRGPSALEAMLWLAVFERCASSLPPRTPVIFLHEVQPWECALVSAWRRLNGGMMTGVVHTIVRPWDLRYHIKGRLVRWSALVPLPERVCSHSEVMDRVLEEEGKGAESVVRVEAIRFIGALSADEPEVQRGDESDSRSSDAAAPNASAGPQLLILGEYDAAYSCRLIEIAHGVSENAQAAGLYWTVVWRPHPARSAIAVPHTWQSLAGGRLVDLLVPGVRVLAGETSTAAFAAVRRGLPVALVPAPRAFSSLEPALSGIAVVSDGDAAFAALRKQREMPVGRVGWELELNPDLPYWRVLAGTLVKPAEAAAPEVSLAAAEDRWSP